MTRILKISSFTLLFFISTVAVFFIANAEPDRSVADLKARWTDVASQFMPIAGMQVHYKDEGPRDDTLPIVLLHGTSASLHTWDGWADALKAQRRVIRFDMPAFGLTGPSPDHDYSIENYASTVISILDTLGVEHCLLGGNSLGGYIAWATAVLYPERIKQLVLVDASGYPFESESVPIGFKIAQTPILNTLMEGVLPKFLVASSVENVFGDPSKVTPELVDRYFELTTRAGNRQALVERFRQTQPGEFSKRVKEINIPTLILWGQLDHLIPPAIADRFHQDIASSTLVRFETLGHVPHEEDPASTVAALKDFLLASADE
jgi:pimeloyl-ACP methyl ester carboxylesterase